MLDVHLGKLARLLRMLGCDAVYQNSFISSDLITIAQKQQRILLSKNSSFQKSSVSQSFFQIHSSDPFTQLQEVTNHFPIVAQAKPFTRCLVCNGYLKTVKKEEIIASLPPNTARFYEEFWQCDTCQKLYWKGPHYNRMMNLLSRFQSFPF